MIDPTSKLQDNTLLEILIASDKVSEYHQGCFQDMLQRLRHRRGHGYPAACLTPKQREWAESLYFENELDVDHEPRERLSAQAIAEARRMPKLAFELMPRPLKPPGVT